MRVYITPTYSGPDHGDGGIRRVVEAQTAMLPSFGWDIAQSPDEADLIACHGASLTERPGVPLVAHSHGLMWEDYNFGLWGDDVNRHVIDALCRAQAITAPSHWVAHAITRGILARPEVVYHGVDVDAWQHDGTHAGYVLWNKARVDPVSDPADMQAVAKLLPDIPFVSTFGWAAPNVTITGAGSYEQMRPVVQAAGLYLATARETFGIGTLEALAAGVPIVGWDYGGQHEIVIQGETGYLAPFGDLHALAECIRRGLAERDRLSANCVADARERWGWRDKIAQYAQVYTRVVEGWRQKRPKVSVVVTAYNLAQYLLDALNSIGTQTMNDHECIVVDDCSDDDSLNTALTWRAERAVPIEQMTVLRTPHNLGLSGARNFGWQRAKGKYILFLDADDMLAPNALDVLSAALDRDPGLHIAYGALDTMSADGTNRKRNPWPSGAFDWRAQIAHLNQLHGAALMRREVLERSGGYRTRDWRAEDASFWARVTSFGFRAARVTDDTIQIYRMHEAQKSRTEDSDGDWTAWLPWSLASDPHAGMRAMQTGAQPNARIVPFGAQGSPPPPRKAWPVRHHQHPVVSIVIPVGPGHAQYLVDALDSVQAQTMPEWECIVVNDTGEEFDLTPWPWARDLPTIGAQGAGYARNHGLALARAPFVLFLDADDVIVPRALELLLKGAADAQGVYAYSDWLTLADERRIDGEMTVHTVDPYSQAAMLKGMLHPVTALIPTEWARAVGGFDEQLPVFEDWDFYCKLAASGFCGVRVAQPLLIYRRESGLRTRAALRPRSTNDTPAYTDIGEQAAAAIIDRFTPWLSGEEQIMACGTCGGQAVTSANDALGDMVQFMTGGGVAPAQPLPAGAQSVRMEFVGAQWGAQTYYGKGSQLPYVAGRDPRNRYHDVDVRDVDHFIALGLFQIVAPEPLLASALPEDMQPVAVAEAPRPPSRVKGRKVTA